MESTAAQFITKLNDLRSSGGMSTTTDRATKMALTSSWAASAWARSSRSPRNT